MAQWTTVAVVFCVSPEGLGFVLLDRCCACRVCGAGISSAKDSKRLLGDESK